MYNNIKVKTFRTKSNNFIIYGYFSIGLIDFMLAGKKLTDFYQFFCPHDFEKNDSIIMSYFKDDWNWQNKLDWSNKILIKWNDQNWKVF